MSCDKEFYCPFCGKNCYTAEQMIQHVKAKNTWAMIKGRPLTHLINKNMDYNPEIVEAKIDALLEFLKLEFVAEVIDNSDGKETICFVRKRKNNKKIYGNN